MMPSFSFRRSLPPPPVMSSFSSISIYKPFQTHPLIAMSIYDRVPLDIDALVSPQLLFRRLFFFQDRLFDIRDKALEVKKELVRDTIFFLLSRWFRWASLVRTLERWIPERKDWNQCKQWWKWLIMSSTIDSVTLALRWDPSVYVIFRNL